MKRIFSLLLSLLLILSLAACGTPANEPVATTTPTPEQTAEPTDGVVNAVALWEVEFLGDVEQRKADITEHNEPLPCGGTAYYVSNAGNDAADGKTPETAWATLDKLKSVHLASGDAVYFERGGLWRGHINCPDGVSLSAYGTGDKPKIYGSAENGAGAEKWTLYHEGDGVNIWKYHRSMNESGGIMLGDLDTVARRVYSWYDGSGFYFTEDTAMPFDMLTALSQDLTFYCDIPMEKGELPYTPHSRECELYLRCDTGNPGELYSSIEFMNGQKEGPEQTIINAGDGCTIDNLCIMFFPDTAIELLSDNATVQNCEIAYGGGAILWFMEPEGTDGACLWTGGQAIFFQGSNEVIHNNYIHEVDGKAVNFEVCRDYGTTVKQIPYSDNAITDNMFENCAEAVYVCNNVIENGTVFDGLLIADNLFIYGDGAWHEGKLSNINPDRAYYCLNFEGGHPNYGGDTISVKGNVFYLANDFLVCRNKAETHEYPETTPHYSDNTFAQATGTMLIMADKYFPENNIPTTTQEETLQLLLAALPNAGEVIVLKP